MDYSDAVQLEDILVQPRVVLKEECTVDTALGDISENGRPVYCIVVNAEHRPVGYVATSDLFYADRQDTVGSVTKAYQVDLLTPTDPFIAVQAFVNRIAPLPPGPIPVVGSDGQMIGAVGANALATALSTEEKVDDTASQAKLWDTAKQRTIWLLITFCSTLLSVAVVDKFQNATSHIAWAPALMPVCGAMGGNAGLQVGTAVIEAMSLRRLFPDCSAMSHVVREVIICSGCGVFFAILFGTVAGWYEEPIAGVMTGVSLFIIFLWSALGGTAIPLVLARFGVDPVVSVGPVLTTLTDVVGYVVFLGLCSLFVPYEKDVPEVG